MRRRRRDGMFRLNGARIEVSAGRDPLGRPCVAVQFPDSWLTMAPGEARRFAGALLNACDDAEAAAREQT